MIKQIAEAARSANDNSFIYDFYNSYDFTNIVFSLGNTVIGGYVLGKTRIDNGVLAITGNVSFYLRDAFSDPLDMHIELPGHQPYPIRDDWGGEINGRILLDRSKSVY